MTSDSSDRTTRSRQPSANELSTRRSRRISIALLSAFIALLVLFGSAHARVALKSAVFMVEIFPDMPTYPLRWFSDNPDRVLVFFPHNDGYEGAFLYRPASGTCHAGMVLYIGLGPEHQDRHLDRISRAFARSGVAVLIPVSETMTNYRFGVDEADIAVSAFQFLQRQGDVDPARVGMFGVSVGGSVVAKAAQHESINDDVAMVHSLGGYYDALDVLVHISLRAARIHGEWVEWEPSDVTIRATRNSILDLMPAADRSALWPLFDGTEETVPEGLTGEGEALARLLVNRDPELVPELVDNLPESLIEYLRAISPSHGIENLKANTLILHDIHDHVLHYSESLRFYDELEGAKSQRLTLIEQFHHVRPGEEGDWRTLIRDGWRLYRHTYHMYRSLDDRGWIVRSSDLVPWSHNSSTCAVE